jgi:hypothetical protein
VLKPGGRLVIEEPDITRFAVKLVALAERLALMGSSFSAPDEICAMIAAHGASARIASDGGFAVWVVAEKAAHAAQPIAPIGAFLCYGLHLIAEGWRREENRVLERVYYPLR